MYQHSWMLAISACPSRCSENYQASSSHLMQEAQASPESIPAWPPGCSEWLGPASSTLPAGTLPLTQLPAPQASPALLACRFGIRVSMPHSHRNVESAGSCRDHLRHTLSMLASAPCSHALHDCKLDVCQLRQATFEGEQLETNIVPN